MKSGSRKMTLDITLSKDGEEWHVGHGPFLASLADIANPWWHLCSRGASAQFPGSRGHSTLSSLPASHPRQREVVVAWQIPGKRTWCVFRLLGMGLGLCHAQFGQHHDLMLS